MSSGESAFALLSEEKDMKIYVDDDGDDGWW